MKRLFSELGAALFFAAALSLAVIPAVEAAAVTPNNVKNSSGGASQVVPTLSVDENGNYAGGAGGGGGGDASAANQTSQITQETAIAGGVGTAADAAATQGSTGSISAKLRTATAQLNTLDGRVDGIETLIGTTNTTLTTIDGRVDGLETLVGATNTAIAALPQNNTLAAGTTGGCTLGKTLSAASTNATSVKGSAGTLCSLTVINTTATLYYLKFYDKATAATCNSDTVLQTIPIPASTTGAGVAVPVGPYGWAFPTGITFCLTAGIADNDNANAATGVAINYSYK